MYTPGFTKPTHGYGLVFGDETAEGGGEDDLGLEDGSELRKVTLAPADEGDDNWAGPGYVKKCDGE